MPKETLKKIWDGVKNSPRTQQAEDLVAAAVIQGEKVYNWLEVDKRAAGAGAGAKAGLALGWKLGPVGIKVCVVGGTLVGFALGPRIINSVNDWLDGHKKKRENSDNDITPK